MRIIAGRLKGRRLQGPDGPGVRPTSDRLRETLFNVLAGRVAGARVLDGFAGTGGVGLEALSRGARHVTFVERDPRVLAVLRRNVEHCRVEGVVDLVRRDVATFPVPGVEPFDIVFLDPPYDAGNLEAVLEHAARLVAPAGLVVLEHSRRVVVPETVATLRRTRAIAAGDSVLSFYAPPTPPDTMSSSGG